MSAHITGLVSLILGCCSIAVFLTLIAGLIKDWRKTKYLEESRMNRYCAGAIMSIIYTAVLAIIFYQTYGFVRKEYIDSYREGRIVEEVKYKVTETNGTSVRTDSTMFYVYLKDE
jgi:hypothetical protein